MDPEIGSKVTGKCRVVLFTQHCMLVVLYHFITRLFLIYLMSEQAATSSRTSFPTSLTQSSSWLKPRKQRRGREIRGAEDDFEVEDAVDYEMDRENEEDDDEGDIRDYETEYDMPMGEYGVQESESFISTEGVEEERIVDYKIDEDEFHKLTLYDCDFFIRRVPDQDDDVFDFREVRIFCPSLVSCDCFVHVALL